MGRTGICQVKLSNTIYNIHTYFLDKATNSYNNLECNNIFFWVPFHTFNLYSRRIIIIKLI